MSPSDDGNQSRKWETLHGLTTKPNIEDLSPDSAQLGSRKMSRNISSLLPSALVNATKAVTQTVEPQQCSHFPDLYFDNGNSSTPYLVNFGFNFIVSVVGVLGNTLVLLAIRKINSLHQPSKLLLGTLVLTDLGVGAIVEPSYMSYLHTKGGEGLSQRSCWSLIIINVFGSTLACASFMTLTAIGMDRYIALYYNTRYRSIVTTKRVFHVLIVIWLVSVFWGTSWHWCFSCYYPICITIMAFCMPISSFSYLKIFLGLRQLQKQRKNQLGSHDQGAAKKLAKYRSTTISMLIVYVLIMLCYTPYLCLVLLIELDGISIYRVRILEYVSALTFFNSAINPFVYCWRIKEIKCALLNYAHKVCQGRSARIDADNSTVVPKSGGFAASSTPTLEIKAVPVAGKRGEECGPTSLTSCSEKAIVKSEAEK